MVSSAKSAGAYHMPPPESAMERALAWGRRNKLRLLAEPKTPSSSGISPRISSTRAENGTRTKSRKAAP